MEFGKRQNKMLNKIKSASVMVNLYNLCVTRSKQELEYFNKVLQFITNLKQGTTLQIVHFNFKSKDQIQNITVNKTPLPVNLYNFDNKGLTTYQTTILTLQDIANLYKPLKNEPIVWIYSGHSDGIYLAKKKLRLFRIEDYCEIVKLVTNRADVMIFDCCLCANINCLYTCYGYTDYVISASSYQSYLSVLHTQSIYRGKSDIPGYCKMVLKEMSSLEQVDPDAYDTNFNIYRVNESVLQLAKLVLVYKDQFTCNKGFVIDYASYKDLDCCFKDIGIDISKLLDKINLWTRYSKTKCVNKKLPRSKNYSIPSRLMIILKRTKRNAMPTKGDIFFN